MFPSHDIKENMKKERKDQASSDETDDEEVDTEEAPALIEKSKVKNITIPNKSKSSKATLSEKETSTSLKFLLILLAVLSFGAVAIIAYEIRQNQKNNQKMQSISIPTEEKPEPLDYNLNDKQLKLPTDIRSKW